MNFNEMNLIEPIMRAINELNYDQPSPIQEKTIPIILEGRDVLGCAQTGSGKTAAFALPLLQLLSAEQSNNIRALIMAPTRELAIQINENMQEYSKYLKLKTGVIFGGVDQKAQVRMLERGVDVLVATPGRLLDLISQGHIDLFHVQNVVLDEADQMLDMGFVRDIRTIIKLIPSEAQKVMFSATMPKPIERLADTMLKDPVTVMQDVVTRTVDTVSQYVYYIDKANKPSLLASLVKTDEVESAIVFTNTKYGADKVVKHLLKAGVEARAIHGNKGQNARQDALLQFKNHTIKVLVATDVAARGIDISKLSHVINYEIPENPETYIHRIGRTGRAGLEGVAINFCCIDEMDSFKKIEAQIGAVVPTLTSEWPMTVFQKKVKEQRKPNPSRRQREQMEDEIIDISKVIDISLTGKPVDRKSKNKYNKEKFRFYKEKDIKGKPYREKGEYEKSSKEKQAYGKSYKERSGMDGAGNNRTSKDKQTFGDSYKGRSGKDGANSSRASRDKITYGESNRGRSGKDGANNSRASKDKTTYGESNKGRSGKDGANSSRASKDKITYGKSYKERTVSERTGASKALKNRSANGEASVKVKPIRSRA